MAPDPGVIERAAHAAAGTPGLDVLLLYGSRARGEAGPQSDWDFGYLADAAIDHAALLASLVVALGTDRVDLADLRRAGGLLRFQAARDGVLVFEASAGAADRFRLEAAAFWCDMAPVLERGYDEILRALSV